MYGIFYKPYCGLAAFAIIVKDNSINHFNAKPFGILSLCLDRICFFMFVLRLDMYTQN